VRLSSLVELLALSTFALVGLVAACSSSSSASSQDGGTDAGPDCGYTAAHNEAGCPATYDTANLPPTCAPVGLNCEYPGAGDGTSPGCASTAVLWCVAGPGDAGAPHWGAAQ